MNKRGIITWNVLTSKDYDDVTTQQRDIYNFTLMGILEEMV